MSIDSIAIGDSMFTVNQPILHNNTVNIYQPSRSRLLPDSNYTIIGNEIHLKNPSTYSETLFILIPPISDSLSNIHTWIDTNLIRSEYLIESLPSDIPNSSTNTQWSNLSYSGHFGRGIQIGNTQNASLQSNFDLQIKGSLPNGMEVVGSLSDNSIPLQPEGNSLQLQEFDNVFIKIKKDNLEMVAGDFEVSNPNRYFMKYYKKTKGLYSSYQSKDLNGWDQTSSANFSTSKGKFNRTSLTVEEGNQGPYRLSTKTNQLFAVILAGTEKVFLDGERLIRGSLNDYTIDYNLGEITFTAKTYISATSRIIVEYELAEQNYLRSLFTGHTSWTKNQYSFSLDLYSEQDGKNSFQNDLLTTENERIISEAGDNIDNIAGSSIIPWEDGYQEGIVLYHLIDSMGYTDILTLAKDGRKPLYTASFTFVGEGQGNYIVSENYTNGDRFVWVSPDASGQPRGQYAPTTTLQAPQIQQMMAFRGQKKWDNGSEIYSEWALSNLDQNRFSNFDQEDNIGWSQLSGFTWRHYLDQSKSKEWTIAGQYEYKGKDFTAITPYRSVEFQRDWNFETNDTSFNESIALLSASYIDSVWQWTYEIQHFQAKNHYSGWQNNAKFSWRKQNFYANGEYKFLNSRSNLYNSKFSRPDFKLGWQNKNLVIETGYTGEKNSVINNDSFVLPSIRFDRWNIKTNWKRKHELEYSHRTDYLFDADQFDKSYYTDDIRWSSSIQNGATNSIKLITTLRHIFLINDEENFIADQQGWNILGQLQFFQKIKKSGFSTNGDLSIGNGKEPRRGFQYIKVEPGNGQYKYVDLNQDSVQQLNEFFPAIYQDEKNYIRVNIVQNELISTFNYGINSTIKFQSNEITEHKFWSKWQLESSVRIENKQQRLGKIKIISIPDSALISSNINFLNNVYINRNGKTVQQHFGYWKRSQKSFLNYGFEQYSTTDLFSKTNVRLNAAVQNLTEINRRKTTQVADQFAERNFIIHFTDIKNTLKWLIQQKMVFELQNARVIGKTMDLNDEALTWKNKISWSYVPNNKWNIQTAFDFSIVKHQYDIINLSLEQVLLDGLRAGNNYLWEANLQRKLPNGLVISLRYNGRKIGDSKVVHNGTMQANLIF
ncbi:hypothetical protein GCM10025777_26880 [Membranihabitans marinus]